MPAESITPGKITYDLRRLRQHGLIERIPRSFRYQVTDTGLARALFLTRLHDRFLRTGMASLTGPAPAAAWPPPPAPTPPPSTTWLDKPALPPDNTAPSAHYSDLQTQELTQK